MSNEQTPTDPNQDGSLNFHDTCHGLSQPIGEVVGDVYGYGTYAAAPELAYVIDKYQIDDKVHDLVGGFVANEGWPAVCDTTESAGHAIADAASSAADWLSDVTDNVAQQFATLMNGTPEPAPAESNADSGSWFGGDNSKAASGGGGGSFWGDDSSTSTWGGEDSGGSSWSDGGTSSGSGDSGASSWGESDSSSSSWGGGDTSSDNP
ncbi:MAG: hypothetical protein ACKN9T_05440 [Candidatus Methylumidiphilus sp.]